MYIIYYIIYSFFCFTAWRCRFFFLQKIRLAIVICVVAIPTLSFGVDPVFAKQLKGGRGCQKALERCQKFQVIKLVKSKGFFVLKESFKGMEKLEKKNMFVITASLV